MNRLDEIKARLVDCPAPVRISNGGLDLQYGDDVFCVELYWGARNQKDDVLFSKMMNFLANSRDDIAWLVAELEKTVTDRDWFAKRSGEAMSLIEKMNYESTRNR